MNLNLTVGWVTLSRKQLVSMRSRRWQIVGVVGVLGLLYLAIAFLTESLWFEEVGYFPVFATQRSLQVGAGLAVFWGSLFVLLLNLQVAQRLIHTPQQTLEPRTPKLGWHWLLLMSLCLSLVVSILLLHYAQTAIYHWSFQPFIYSNVPTRLRQFHLGSFWQIGQKFIAQPWLLVGVVGVAIALLINPKRLLPAIAVLMSLCFAVVFAERWTEILAATQPTGFERREPLLGLDIGFYIFQLPVLELLRYWILGLFTLALTSASLTYLLSRNSLSEGRFEGLSRLQRHHLYGLGGCFLLAIALYQWIDRYELLFSPRGVTFGASYADATVQLPADTALSILSAILGLLLLSAAFYRSKLKEPRYSNPRMAKRIAKSAPIPSGFLAYGIAIYLLIVTLIGLVLPFVVQKAVVQPNELLLEIPYLKRAIALTREAYELNQIDEETFSPQGNLTAADFQNNQLTINNIRLWDTRPLLETNRQLQRFRPYYEFYGADIDRYTLKTATGSEEQRQVLIAPRELDYNSVPQEAQTWINQHLIYTHGYGFTMSPVNTAAGGGLPEYFVQGIEDVASRPEIQASLPLEHPRIYYGELTNTYIMTQTRVQELDFPSGSENIYNTYSGLGGIPIGNFARRLLFAIYLRDWQMLLTEEFTPDTKLLFRRNIVERVQTIAPFLKFDRDPYLVVSDIRGAEDSDANSPSPNYLYWIIDAYTTSNHYPYSDPLGKDFNYIRNSVKIVVDAYHGSVYFYVSDPLDPIIQTWSKIFPGMFRSFDEMPSPLQSHVRYPLDFYRTQSDQLMVYHMTDPQVFYNREDVWRAPNEVYADELRLVEPYYLIMKLPAEEREEFVLLRPYTPSQRTNLIAWLAARSDRAFQAPAGRDRPSKMLLYRFPKQRLVFGPEQLEARINQDPIISQQISLWNRQGSSASQGNLLVIPIEQSLLYTEPLYLEATLNRLPTLVRVIAAYQDRIVMAETLDQALRALFQPTDDPQTIIRPFEEFEGEFTE